MSTNTNLLSKVSVIVLGVSDVAKSVAFYRDSLGLEFKGQHETLAFFSVGDVTDAQRRSPPRHRPTRRSRVSCTGSPPAWSW